MPKKLEDCVRDVRAQGHDKNAAYAICAKSTGWVRTKGGGRRQKKKKKKKTITESAMIKIEQLLENNHFSSLKESYWGNSDNDYLSKYRKGVYAQVTLDPIALERIWRYLKKLNLPLMPMQRAHVTVIYSKNRPKANPRAWDINGAARIKGFGIFGKGTPDQPYVLALKLDSQALQHAHMKWRKDYGLKPTYSKYEPHLTLTYDITRIFPGLKKMSEKQKKVITNIFDKMLVDLPKEIKILKHSVEP